MGELSEVDVRLLRQRAAETLPPDHPCLDDSAGYCEWHGWALEKQAKGHRQALCGVCARWKFKSERCRRFKEATTERETQERP